ncbi:MAG: arylsulfatase, partial [Verrucomicrobia bacterium]|nr:arylsulfatase [Verrucomicrobiota bacterium]
MKTIFIQTHRGNVPVRYHHFAVRNQRWKLVHPTGFGRLAPRDDVPCELYKMAVDPREEKNLAVQYPGVVAQLKDAYDIRFDDVSTTRPDNYDPPRIVVGTDCERR